MPEPLPFCPARLSLLPRRHFRHSCGFLGACWARLERYYYYYSKILILYYCFNFNSTPATHLQVTPAEAEELAGLGENKRWNRSLLTQYQGTLIPIRSYLQRLVRLFRSMLFALGQGLVCLV